MKSSCKDRKYLRGVLGVGFFLSLLCAIPSFAQTITPVTDLDFGVIAIRDYNAVGRVTLLPGGAFNYNSNVYIHEPPTRGEYLIQGFPANSFYTVTLPASVPLVGAGTSFTLDNFVVEPAVLFTDASGDDTFYIIGRLQTQGGGIVYLDATYGVTFPVTVNF